MAYTAIDDPSAHFQATIYTGNGSANHAITNAGNSDLQPDLVWIKNRSADDSHCWFDSSRGATKLISSDTDGAETTDADTLDSFASDGFQVDADVKVNTNTELYASWQWKANGGTTSSNTTGDINTTVQVNSDAGFSIITYTGNNTDDQTIGHGLGAVPEFAIFKSRAGAAGTGNWSITHSAFSGTEYIFFTAAVKASANNNFKSTPTSTVFTLGDSDVNEAETLICYAWTPIQGYSKFGSYKGNGNASGPFIHTGFKPALVLLKKHDTSTGNWYIHGNARHPFNPITTVLYPDGNWAQGTSTDLDFVSNGFKLFDSASTYTNIDGVGYIYAAFAEQPFVTSGGVPCTAR